MNINRKINRIKFHFLRRIISFISLFNHRLHMKFYIPLLKGQGMKFEGTPRYIGVHVKFDDFPLIGLGNRVVISDHCIFLTHDYSLTTALIAIGEQPKSDRAFLREIKVGNNVFIGTKSIIMPNTSIGDNVIIGAGSVVRGKLESNSVYIGNPAMKIRSINEVAEKWKKTLINTKVRVD